MSLTAEQLELRSTGIGASEAAAACGLSPYEQTVELYLRKIGQAPPIDETEEMLFGTCIEAGGIEFWSRLNGIPVRHPMPTVRHPEHAFVLATPDGEISAEEGLEFKSMGLHLARKVDQYGIAEVCPHYIVQAQQQMAVMGWKVVRLVALVERKLREWPIERNERLISNMLEREAMFWDHVERRIPPDIDFTKAGALKAVQALYPEIREGAVIQLDEETSVLWEAYAAAGKEITSLEKTREGYKAAVLSKIGENYAGVLANGEKMVRRKVIERKGYTVEPCEYVDARAVKYDGSPILNYCPALLPEPSDVDDGEFDDSDDTVRRVDFRLREAGFICHDTSPSGSRYYVHAREMLRVRLADHDANAATAAWKERQGIVREIRIENGRSAAMEQLQAVLDELEPAELAAT